MRLFSRSPRTSMLPNGEPMRASSIDSRFLSRLRGPVGRFNTELLGVLGVQSLPAAELHGLGADDAPNGLTGEKPIQHIEADVPARSAHRYESTVDVVPKREPSAAASHRLQFPADVLSPPAEFEQLGRVGPLHLGLGYMRRRRPHGRELCGANGTEVPVRIERSRERLPNLGRRGGEVADENERPLLSLFSDLSARSGTRRVWLTAAHVFSFLSQRAPSLRTSLSSKVST